MVPGTNALLAVSVPEGKQGSAFGLAASMQSLALLIGPLGGGFVSGLAGNPAVYFTIGVMLMLTAIPAYLFIREPDMFTVRERPAPVSSH
jgi:MFS family permease